MSDGKSSSDDKSQAGGPARATAAVGTAAVGRAVVPGEEAPPASGAPAKPAEGAASNGSASADKPTGGSADAAASKPPVASTPPKPSVPPSGPAKPSEPSITGSLRPSVVNSGQASGSTSVPPVPPPLNSSLRAVSTPTKSAPPVSTPPAAAHPPIATPPTAARPVTPPLGGAQPGGAQSTGVRPGGTAPSASAGRTSVMGVAGAGSNVGMASAVGTAPGVAAPAAGAATARTQVGEAVRNVRATVAAAASRGPRRARLQLKKIDPWSVMKFSFAASLVLFIVSVVATALLYTVLDAMDVFDSLNKTIGSLTATADQANSGGEEFVITAKLVIGSAALLGAVNMVLFTALATLGAFVYNVCADLVGGIEVTLAERD